MALRFALILILGVASSLLAVAEVADYCAAYARDHADQGVRQKPKWQLRYDNALKTCTEQFSIQENALAGQKPKKPVVKKVVQEEAKPIPKVKPASVTKTPEPKKPDNAAKPKAGSAEWVKYCKKKYVSFNEAKGTYLSKTGVERKCLVTAD